MTSNQKNTKLNKLLSKRKDESVYTSPWLFENGYMFLFQQFLFLKFKLNLLFWFKYKVITDK